MKRLTSDDTKSIFYDLNLFFAKDNEVWIRGGGPEPDYQDCTLVNWIGRVADKHNLEIYARDAVNLGDEMYDCLQYGIDTIEGVVALLHAAAVQATTMRSRLKEIEDILGDDYDLDRLKELVEADIEGRCVVLPCKVGDTIYTIGASICKWREIDHCDEYCDGQQYRDCWEGESTVLERKFGLYDIVSINKTVFLTREEAEAALEKMKGGNE